MEGPLVAFAWVSCVRENCESTCRLARMQKQLPSPQSLLMSVGQNYLLAKLLLGSQVTSAEAYTGKSDMRFSIVIILFILFFSVIGWFANARHRGTGSQIPPLPRAEFGRLTLE